MDSSPVRPRLPERTSTFGALVAGLNGIGTVWIFVLMLLVNLDIAGRALFNAPLPGVFEIVEMSIVGIVFLQAGHTLRLDKFTRSDSLYRRLLERRPRIGHGLAAFYDLTGAILFLILCWGTFLRFRAAWTEGYYVGQPGLFQAPIWPIYLIIVIGCAVLSIQFLAQARSHLAQTRRGAADESHRSPSIDP